MPKIFALGRFPIGVAKRLIRSRHRKDYEIVDLALLFWRHPLIGIEGTIASIAAWDATGNSAGHIRNIEALDLPCGVFASKQARP